MQGDWNFSNYNTAQYVVKPGDSLYMIAKANGITVDELKSANNLVSNVIYPNQVLLIPKKNNYTCNKTYTTELGDSIKNILSRHNITIDDLVFYNDLDKLTLEGNQLLYIDKKKNTYKPSENDTIESILAKYNLTPMEFLKLNEAKLFQTGEVIISK